MKRVLAWSAALLIAFWILGGIGILGPPIEMLFFLIAGWMFFLKRTLPLVHFNWGDLSLAGTAVILFIVGTHAFLRSILSQRPQSEAVPNLDRLVDLRWHWSFGRTLALTFTVLLAFAAGTSMVGIVHQLTWMATSKEPLVGYGSRQAARRISSVNQLRQQALGIVNYNDVRHSFPGGCTRDLSGTAMHGWITQILPYLEENSLYHKIDHQAPWTAPQNVPHFQHELDLLISTVQGYRR